MASATEHRQRAEVLLEKALAMHPTSPAKGHLLQAANAHATLAMVLNQEDDKPAPKRQPKPKAKPAPSPVPEAPSAPSAEPAPSAPSPDEADVVPGSEEDLIRKEQGL